jgi:hypothetical protein
MNMKVHVRNLVITLSSAQKIEAAYRHDSRELVVTYEPPEAQAIEVSTDEGSASLQIDRVEVHLSDEAVRDLAASVPSDVLKQ